jgi:ABC-type Zn uptake system ZnuABC Zn-binding protein ZnuA
MILWWKIGLRLTFIVILGISLSALVSPTTSGYTQDDPLRRSLNIVTTTSIIADVVRQVAGPQANIIPLVSLGSDPHGFTPTARHVSLLEEADVVFINGASFEGSLLPLLNETASGRLVVVSNCVSILRAGLIGIEHDHAEDAHENDASFIDTPTADSCSAHETELARLGVSLPVASEHPDDYLGQLEDLDCALGDNCDPHVWFDVRNVMLWTLIIRDQLSLIDPANQAVYAENAQGYLTELQALDVEISTLLEAVPVDQRLLVTNHDVLGYLAYRYQYSVIGTILPSATTGSEPSLQEIVQIIEVIEDYGARAIFLDSVASGSVARQIAEETGVKVVVLYTESLTDVDGPASSYVAYMRANAMLIANALQEDA